MKTHTKAYRGFRFPGEVISHGVWLYHRFTLSFRDVEELLGEAGNRRHPRDHPAVVSEVRPRVRSKAQASPGSAG